jgi:hypothetical protein
MPQINGFDLAEEIKKTDQNVRVCFLIAGEVPGKLRANQFRVEEKDMKTSLSKYLLKITIS